MLKSCGWVGGWLACKILETAQSPNSSFPFLFEIGLGIIEMSSFISIPTLGDKGIDSIR